MTRAIHRAVMLRLKRSMCVNQLCNCLVQADHMLAQFKVSAHELHDAIGQLAAEDLATAEETKDDMESVRLLLQRARFELSAEKAALLARYRDACDRLKEPFEQLQSSCKDILETVRRMKPRNVHVSSHHSSETGT